MIGVYKEKVANIPSLVVVDQHKEGNPLPTVTYFHGFTSAKEHNLPLAYLLAEKGFRVILPDSKFHGEREENISDTKLQLSFWDIVLQNVQELSDIKRYLDEHNLIDNEMFGVAGTSMGGITTASALTQYSWIKTAGILMGSPKTTTYAKALVNSFRKNGELPIPEADLNRLYEQLENIDLSLQVERLNERPLLFWHGENDSVVPFDHSYSFYQSAKRHYQDEKNIQFIREVNRDHKVSRFAILETVKWFENHLLKGKNVI